jgi:hypothetical protein
MITQQLPAHAAVSVQNPDRAMDEGQGTFLDCPAWQDQDGTARCGLPAEVKSRYTMHSTGGPLESVMIRCPSGHWFNGPIEFLKPDSKQKHAQANATTASSAGRGSLTADHDGPDGTRRRSRPNGAPAYYLGRPAWRWITATSPRHARTALTHPTQAVTGG